MSKFFNVEEALLNEAGQHPQWMDYAHPPVGLPQQNMSPEAAKNLYKEFIHAKRERERMIAEYEREVMREMERMQRQALNSLRTVQPPPIVEVREEPTVVAEPKSPVVEAPVRSVLVETVAPDQIEVDTTPLDEKFLQGLKKA